ncbi:dispanin subfamily A member 2b-like protein [Labeo rohita]|uniref:Dispanin subfamily A member 2b-like protein n=1 Tax=Labeo rohita TaxID=84645 RepID=A0A498P067_LABRO|nr:dispanin subfamily A member 2b-like protein [Labeo rohita]
MRQYNRQMQQNRLIQYNRQMQQNRQIQQNLQGPRKVQVKVKDYLRCSVFTITFCNCLFLGTAALICGLKAINRKYMRDVKGAKKFSCCALAANIFAIITTVITITLVGVFARYRTC